MLSLAALKDYGADTGAGLRRCMNNESFYLRLVGMVLADKNFAALRAALGARVLTLYDALAALAE